MQLGFGSGALWGILTGSNQTPARFGILQNCGLDFKSNIKSLFGTNQLPVSVARGTMSVSGKAEIAQFTSRLYNDLFFGSMSTPATGTSVAQDSESGTVPAVPAYTITVANSATWTRDLGVVYAATGLPLTRGATASAVGIYSVAAGVYTFNSADASAAVKISYVYTLTSGETLTIANKPIGDVTPFITVLSLLTPNTTKKMTFTLNSCISDSLSMNTALEDYTKQQLSFAAFTDSSDTLGTIAFAEAI